MSKIRVLQIISGNDVGGGANHVLNLSYYSSKKFKCIIGAIGEGPLYEKAINMNIESVNFSKNMLKCKDEIYKYVLENDIDLIDFHGAKAFLLHCFLKKSLRIPSVATIHSNYRQDFLNSKFKFIFFTHLSIKGLESFNYYVCVSKYIRNLMIKDGFKGEKFIVSNGINYDTIKLREDKKQIREKLNIDLKDFVFVNVARMHPVKNQLNLIIAFAKLEKEIKNIKLIIVGDGPLEQSLKEKANSLNLRDKVIFTGFKENAVDYINASNISILNSLSEGGCPPLVVLESAAVKVPVIATKVGDLDELINKETGFIVENNDVDGIYKSMKDAYENKHNLSKMGTDFYNFCTKNYSTNTFCNNYYDVYKKILTYNRSVNYGK